MGGFERRVRSGKWSTRDPNDFFGGGGGPGDIFEIEFIGTPMINGVEATQFWFGQGMGQLVSQVALGAFGPGTTRPVDLVTPVLITSGFSFGDEWDVAGLNGKAYDGPQVGAGWDPLIQGSGPAPTWSPGVGPRPDDLASGILDWDNTVEAGGGGVEMPVASDVSGSTKGMSANGLVLLSRLRNDSFINDRPVRVYVGFQVPNTFTGAWTLSGLVGVRVTTDILTQEFLNFNVHPDP